MAIERELIDVDPLSGLRTYLEFDDLEPTKFKIRHLQDVEPILEHNKALQNEPDYKKGGIKQGWQHVAHIPDIVILEWLKEGIDVMNKDHWPAVKRKLADPGWRYLRTTLGGI